jgi:hypothetical protein
MKYFKKLHILFILLLLNSAISCTEQTEIIYPSALDLPVQYGSTLKLALNGDDRAQVDIAFAYIKSLATPGNSAINFHFDELYKENAKYVNPTKF